MRARCCVDFENIRGNLAVMSLVTSCVHFVGIGREVVIVCCQLVLVSSANIYDFHVGLNSSQVFSRRTRGWDLRSGFFATQITELA